MAEPGDEGAAPGGPIIGPAPFGENEHAGEAAPTEGYDPNAYCSIYIGNVDPTVTEAMLHEIFAACGTIRRVKVVKDRQMASSSGFAFVDFADHAQATESFALNGRILLGRDVRLNWANTGTAAAAADCSSHYHIFVGDISPEVDHGALYAAFLPYGHVTDARVMLDPVTDRPRGYGFVAFLHRDDAERALKGMEGQLLGTRHVRCNWANAKSGQPQPGPGGGGGTAPTQTMDAAAISAMDPFNTNIYVGGLDERATALQLTEAFSMFGVVMDVKLLAGKGFGFVRMDTHAAAVAAIALQSGKPLGLAEGGTTVRCSWGKGAPAGVKRAAEDMLGGGDPYGWAPRPAGPIQAAPYPYPYPPPQYYPPPGPAAAYASQAPPAPPAPYGYYPLPPPGYYPPQPPPPSY